MKYKGFLQGLELSDVIQLMSMKSASCVIEVENSSNKKGVLYLKDGKLISAEVDKKVKGDNAALEIFSWDSAVYRELPWKEPPEENIKSDTIFLMMEAIRIKDEMKKNKINNRNTKPRILKNKHPVIKFLSNSKSRIDLEKRILALLTHNFTNTIKGGVIINENNKLTIFAHSSVKNNFSSILTKIVYPINLTKKFEMQPLFIPIKKDLDAIIISKNSTVFITLVNNYNQERKITNLIYLFTEFMDNFN